MVIEYIGSFYDPSGYGIAARNNLTTLNNLGVDIIGKDHSFAPRPDLLSDDEKLSVNTICSRNKKSDVTIIHLTPEQWPRYYNNSDITIGHMAWETTRIHNDWVYPCNNVDGILVPCEWNIEVLKNSKVKKPVKLFPHFYDINKFINIPKWSLTEKFNDKLKFYSIFQWSERKNPIGLLKTYFSTFSAEDDVVLILKTYQSSGNQADIKWVVNEINEIKNSINKSSFPKVQFISDMLSEEKINQLHFGCDVYLAPVRGEGFAMTILDAALAGNHVISTNFSSMTDYLSDSVHCLLDYQLTTVSNMPWIPWYMSDQFWADPNNIQMSDCMLKFYNEWKINKSLDKDRQIEYSNNILKTKYSNSNIRDTLMSSIKDIIDDKQTRNR